MFWCFCLWLFADCCLIVGGYWLLLVLFVVVCIYYRFVVDMFIVLICGGLCVVGWLFGLVVDSVGEACWSLEGWLLGL